MLSNYITPNYNSRSCILHVILWLPTNNSNRVLNELPGCVDCILHLPALLCGGKPCCPTEDSPV